MSQSLFRVSYGSQTAGLETPRASVGNGSAKLFRYLRSLENSSHWRGGGEGCTDFSEVKRILKFTGVTVPRLEIISQRGHYSFG